MIDEKRLDEMEAAEPTTFGNRTRLELIRLARIGLSHEKYQSSLQRVKDFHAVAKRLDELDEQDRLLALGIWAKNHGARALKVIHESQCGIQQHADLLLDIKFIARDALALLPKGET